MSRHKQHTWDLLGLPMPELREDQCKYCVVEKNELRVGNTVSYQCKREEWDGEYCFFHSENTSEKKELWTKVFRDNYLQNFTTFLYNGALHRAFDFIGFVIPERERINIRSFDDVFFDYATIGESVRFTTCRFESFHAKCITSDYWVTFEEILFNGYTNFLNSIFGKYNSFIDITFNGHTVFSESHFGSNAVFISTTFNEAAVFVKAYFQGGMDFGSVDFHDRANFGHSYFGDSCKFSGTQFGNQVDFFNASFGKSVEFFETQFDDVVSFMKAKFKSSYFISTFAKVVFFTDCKFGSDESHNYHSFKYFKADEVDLTGCDLSHLAFHDHRIDRIRLSRNTFGKLSFLNGIIIGSPPVKICEEREGWSLKPRVEKVIDMIIFEHEEDEKVEFIQAKEDSQQKFKEAETVYSRFKGAYLDQHHYKLARKMRAGELEMRRLGEAPWSEKVFLWFYRFINGYGLRWARAAVIWFLAVLVFSLSFFINEDAFKESLKSDFDIEITNAEQISDEEERRAEIVKVEKKYLKPLGFSDALLHSIQVGGVITTPTYIIKRDVAWCEFFLRIISPFLLFMIGQAIRNSTRA